MDATSSAREILGTRALESSRLRDLENEGVCRFDAFTAPAGAATEPKSPLSGRVQLA